MADETNSDIAALTVQLLSAFVANNTVSSDSLAELIKTTRAALTEDLMDPATVNDAAEFVPAVSVRKSLSSRDFIISLIDGKPYKTLKRHLTQHGLTPEQYRERYKLSKTYPLVAPNYSDARRAVAKKLGLGRKPSSPAPIEEASPAPTAPNAQTSVKAQKTSAASAAKGRKRLSIAAHKDGTTAAPTPPNTETSATASRHEAAEVAATTSTAKQKRLPKTKAAQASRGPASRSAASTSTNE